MSKANRARLSNLFHLGSHKATVEDASDTGFPCLKWMKSSISECCELDNSHCPGIWRQADLPLAMCTRVRGQCILMCHGRDMRSEHNITLGIFSFDVEFCTCLSQLGTQHQSWDFFLWWWVLHVLVAVRESLYNLTSSSLATSSSMLSVGCLSASNSLRSCSTCSCCPGVIVAGSGRGLSDSESVSPLPLLLEDAHML